MEKKIFDLLQDMGLTWRQSCHLARAAALYMGMDDGSLCWRTASAKVMEILAAENPQMNPRTIQSRMGEGIQKINILCHPLAKDITARQREKGSFGLGTFLEAMSEEIYLSDLLAEACWQVVRIIEEEKERCQIERLYAEAEQQDAGCSAVR